MEDRPFDGRGRTLADWTERRRANFEARRQMAGLLARAPKGLVAAHIAVGALGAVVPLVMAVATGSLVNGLRDAVEADAGATRRVVTSLVVVIGCVVVLQVVWPAGRVVLIFLSRAIDRQVRDRTLLAVQSPATMAHLEDPDYLNKVHQSKQAVFGTPGLAAVALVSQIMMYAQAIGSAAIVARFSVPVAVGLFLAALLVRVQMRRGFLELGHALNATASHMRRMNSVRSLVIDGTAAKELRVFGLPEWLRDRCLGHRQDAYDRIRGARSKLGRGLIGASVLLAAAQAAVFVLVALAGIRGDVSPGTVVVVIEGAVGIIVMCWLHHDFLMEYGIVQMGHVLELEEIARSDTAARPTRQPPERLARGVEFKNVSFSYPSSPAPVLEGLDLSIKAGHSTALVGVNGVGKTTIIKLLAGLLHPTGGSVLVDGVPLAELDPSAWQRRLAVLFQDFTKFHLPAMANVGLGAPDAPWTADALDTAARKAGADGIVAALPSGWDTVLNRGYESGADLSGGEWQRLALARAMFAVGHGAELLVLDEPTANMDVRAEAELFDRFLDITRGLTTVIVSHRFSTVRRADTIVVLDEGGITEQGSHDALLALDGVYASMFKVQARRFDEEEELRA